MFQFIIKVFWFFLPAAFANMSPIVFRSIPFLDTPVDFGRSLGGKRIFGDHKTWRGLFFGIIAAGIVFFFQIKFFGTMKSYSLIDYAHANVFWGGLLLGAGALLGDLLKSFFKRRFNIAPGHDFALYDQIDWILGAYFFSLFLLPFNLEILIVSLIMFGFLHELVNIVAYFLKIRQRSVPLRH